MRRLLPLLFVLVACDGELSSEDGTGLPGPVLPPEACEQTLTQERAVVVGHLVGAEFEALSEGSPLPVHTGGQGGWHSDLLLRTTGPGADVERSRAVRLETDVSGGWTESTTSHLIPECRDLGGPGYYAQVRHFWDGPPVEIPSEPEECGDDPCGDDPDSVACDDYLDCREAWSNWYEWKDDGWLPPAIGWDELVTHTATIETTVTTGEGALRTVDLSVGLIRGVYDEEAGG